MNDCCKRGVCLWTAVLLLNGLAGPARADGERLVLRDFRAAGADFAFLQWQEALRRVPAGLEVGGPETKGQGGFGASAPLNATGFADAVPVIRLMLGEHNQAEQINFGMSDADTWGVLAARPERAD